MISDQKAAAKARVRAKAEALKALPASERIANTLRATHTAAEAEELLAEVRAETERRVRQLIAADFQAYGKQHDTLSWGQAFYIARDGLNGGAR